MNKPLIGVVPLYDAEKESYWMLPDYMKAVEAAGGLPVMLPLTADREAIRSLAETFDGFLFTGGQDVHPDMYGEPKEPFCGEICEERDAMEKELLELAIRLDKPVFGICRGFQLINAALGGSLYQDLPTQRPDSGIVHRQPKPYDRPVHRVVIVKDSPLHRILGTEELMVNSLHHQGVKRLADRLEPLAFAEDGLIEAAHMPDRTFLLAVQWHPEYSYRADARQLRLFEEFVRHCRPVD